MKDTVREACELQRGSEIVTLPTGTVDGLAADAFNPEAVAKVFGAKQRSRLSRSSSTSPRGEI